MNTRIEKTNYYLDIAEVVAAREAFIAAGGADWGPYAQVIIGGLLTILAVILVIEGISTLRKPKKVTA